MDGADGSAPAKEMLGRWVCQLFFFSSRRRHTRLTCDWSSDVCSSDLRSTIFGVSLAVALEMKERVAVIDPQINCQTRVALICFRGLRVVFQCVLQIVGIARSEERRVGKECRSRRSPLR